MSVGRGRGEAGPRHGASEGGTQKPRAAASGREEGQEADRRRLGHASRLLGQVPFPLLPPGLSGRLGFLGPQTGWPMTGRCGPENQHMDRPIDLRPGVFNGLVRAASRLPGQGQPFALLL